MSDTNPTTSHVYDLVAQITQGDPEKAKALIEFCALTDPSTPLGAALRLDALAFAYSFTDEGRQGLERMMRGNIPSLSASRVATSSSIS